jgi:ribonuclease BN (tRNA processing enzyme)
MDLIFLGSGSGLISPKENYHSNLVLRDDDGSLMAIDAGSHFQSAIEEIGFNVEDFNAFYITHLHADHVGGLEWVALMRYFGPNGIYKVGRENYRGPRIIGNAEILDDLWSKVLSGGLEALTGRPNVLDTFFTVDPLPPNGTFAWHGVVFDIVQTVHTMDNRRVKPSYGLMFRINNRKIFFTGDTQFCPNQINGFYEDADVIFHDCELANYPGSVHAQYHELCKLPEKYRKKMWLYHYQGPVPEEGHEAFGFQGFVEKGQMFEF